MRRIAGLLQWSQGPTSGLPATDLSTHPYALPPALAQGFKLTTSNLLQWLTANLVPIIVIVAIGIPITFAASKKDAPAALTVFVLFLVAAAAFAIGTIPGATIGVGKFVLGLIGIGG